MCHNGQEIEYHGVKEVHFVPREFWEPEFGYPFPWACITKGNPVNLRDLAVRLSIRERYVAVIGEEDAEFTEVWVNKRSLKPVRVHGNAL